MRVAATFRRTAALTSSSRDPSARAAAGDAARSTPNSRARRRVAGPAGGSLPRRRSAGGTASAAGRAAGFGGRRRCGFGSRRSAWAAGSFLRRRGSLRGSALAGSGCRLWPPVFRLWRARRPWLRRRSLRPTAAASPTLTFAPFLHVNLGHAAGVRAGDLDHGLVGFDLEHVLIGL